MPRRNAEQALTGLTEPSDLDAAIRIGQQLLDSGQVVSLREALRILLRALGAENHRGGEGQ